MFYISRNRTDYLEVNRISFLKGLARPFISVIRETEDELEWEIKGNYYVTPFVNELPNEGYIQGKMYTPVDKDIEIWGLEVTRILY